MLFEQNYNMNLELFCHGWFRRLVGCLLMLCLPVVVRGNGLFNHLTISEGLAHTDANCIAQDSTGLIWIGTYAGLQNYDGYTLQRFDYYSREQNIYKSHNRIRALACTGDYLWVGTESGLTCFDLKIQKYVRYKTEGDVSALGESIAALCFNPRKKELLIKTDTQVVLSSVEGEGIHVLPWSSDEERNRCRVLDEFHVYGGIIWGKNGWSLFQLGVRSGKAAVFGSFDSALLCGEGRPLLSFGFRDGKLYVRSDTGLGKIALSEGMPDTSNRAWLPFGGKLSGLARLGSSRFVITDKGNLWLADNYGLVEIISPFSASPQVREYLREYSGENRSVRRMTDMMIDSYDNLWVSTVSWGVFFRSLSDSYFHTLSGDVFHRMGFLQNEIVAVCEQQDGTVWMLVEYNNLFRYIPDEGRICQVGLDIPDEGRMYIYQSLYLSRDERFLYIGSVDGIWIYTVSTGRCRRLVSGRALDHAGISGMAEDSCGRLWVATWGDGVYCVSDPAGSPSVDVCLSTETSPSLVSNRVNFVRIRGNDVFLCTINGLNRIRLGKSGGVESISAYQTDAGKGAHSMSTNFLADMDWENDSVCWLGTIGGGVNRLVLHSYADNDYTATVYGVREGLPDNDCEIVMIDRFGRVWIGSNSMTCLDSETGRVYVYDDEARNTAFKIHACFKGKTGTFYMGGLYGLTGFHPDRIPRKLPSDRVPDLVFSNLSVNNVLVVPRTEYDGTRILERSLDYTDRIRLNHKQGNFSVSFSALGYRQSHLTVYRYRMTGLSGEWMTLPHDRNSVYFSNLPYGTYELEVQCSTDGGYSWLEPGRTIGIEMLPPWWLSGWAKAGYVLLAVSILVVVFRRYDRERKLENENAIQKILLEQDEEKYQAKIRFFMNVSHELKTPLTLILLSAEKLVKENRLSKECNAILCQTKRMLTLISELVDFRKTDLGISKVKLGRVDLTHITRRLLEEIAPWADNKRISFFYEVGQEEVVLDADPERICRMIMNLLSNAVKYTAEGGEIKVSLHRGTPDSVKPYYPVSHTEGVMDSGKESCILTVRDTGVGISADSIRLIYERFFQVKGTSDSHLGSGIGLAIVKNIVMQHGGMIIVSSERGKGTEFIVMLPIYNKCADSFGTVDFDVNVFIQENSVELPALDEGKEETERIDNPELPLLLIVEDNKDLRDALREHFSAIYNVRTASDGKEGLELCQSVFPDIIVSDVMMPEMDGIELCRRIKNNLSVAYIPVVLLTAKDNVESQIDGYESGADLYLGKPFSMKLLEVNVRRLLDQRKRWMEGKAPLPEEKSGKTVPLSGDERRVPESAEKKERALLVDKLKVIISEHLNETELSIDFLVSEMGISRTQLYQKVGRIDGMSLADYVRSCRLDKAAELLKHSSLTVQQIVYEVGLINPSHFSKIFKMKYGVSPYEYRQGAV